MPSCSVKYLDGQQSDWSVDGARHVRSVPDVKLTANQITEFTLNVTKSSISKLHVLPSKKVKAMSKN